MEAIRRVLAFLGFMSLAAGMPVLLALVIVFVITACAAAMLLIIVAAVLTLFIGLDKGKLNIRLKKDSNG